jgi:hypothetical protein
MATSFIFSGREGKRIFIISDAKVEFSKNGGRIANFELSIGNPHTVLPTY